MTVSNEVNSITYNGDGSTVNFTYPFKVYADADLLVVVTSSGGVDTTLALNTDYTVISAGSESGEIILDSGALCPSGSTITISRDMSLTQATDFVDGGAFSAENVEASLDRVVLLLQQLKGAILDLEAGSLSSASYSAFIADMIETLDATAYLTSSYIMKSLLTTEGDTIYASSANTPARLAKGGGFSITYHTYDISTASGTQTLTGAGFTPSMAVFLTGLGGGGVASGVSAKFGTFEGRMSIFNASTLTGGYMNTLFSPTTTSGNTQVGTLAFNSDGGEITWTKTGSPTGTYQIIAIWFR